LQSTDVALVYSLLKQICFEIFSFNTKHFHKVAGAKLQFLLRIF
jgi:hypothetical protein